MAEEFDMGGDGAAADGPDTGIDEGAGGDGADSGLPAGPTTGDADFDSLYAQFKAGADIADQDDTDATSADDDASGDRPESEDTAPPRPRSQERIVQRLQRSEERVHELETRLKSLQEAKAPVQFKRSGDLVDDVVSMIADELGCEPTDDRVAQRIFDLGGMLTAELMVREGRGDDPRVKERVERRRSEREKREIQRQIDELKTENQRKEAQLRLERDRQNGISGMTAFLKQADAESTYPHLYAAEDDVVSAVFQGIAALAESGHQMTEANAADTIAYVCSAIDGEHRARYERIAARKSAQGSPQAGGKPWAQPIQRQQPQAPRPGGTRGALRDGPSNRREDRGGRTVTASGVGSRHAPVTKSDADRKPDDIFAEAYAEFQEEQRRGRARPGR